MYGVNYNMMFSKDFFSLRLKEVRKGLTQAQAAQKVGLSQQGWARYETGKLLPGAEAIHQICSPFGVSADWLLGLPERGGAATVTAGDGAAGSLGSGSATASNCRDCPILLDFINRRSAGKP